MAKNKRQSKPVALEADPFDFPPIDGLGMGENEAMMGVMTQLLDTCRHQTQYAMELTRLIVEHAEKNSLDEAEIFRIFEKASTVVSKNNVMEDIIDKLN